MRTFLTPIDRLTLCLLALLMAVMLFFVPTVHAWPQPGLTYLLLALTIISLAVLDRRAGTGKILSSIRVFAPIAIIAIIFNSLGDLITGIGNRHYDDILIQADYALFGVHPTVWMERFNDPLLTGLLQAAYMSYYGMPIALALALYFRENNDAFNSAVFAILLCFYLSYIGYLLVPAVGPRYTLGHVQTAELRAGPVTLWIRQALDGLEHNKTDAFPSGHTAVALVTLVYAWKYREKVLSWILVPAVSALIFSTVYLRYHYVVDVIAGVLLAALTILIAPKTYRLFSGSSDRPQG
ncbi:MAG: phosphatase PAP2 family protein [Nitrospirae bacterium]|nr:phosphatase PAP2 family protein [Nitrospirota bacterium]